MTMAYLVTSSALEVSFLCTFEKSSKYDDVNYRMKYYSAETEG